MDPRTGQGIAETIVRVLGATSCSVRTNKGVEIELGNKPAVVQTLVGAGFHSAECKDSVS